MRRALACSRAVASLTVVTMTAVLFGILPSGLGGGRALAEDETSGQVTESAALAAAKKSGRRVEVLSLRGESREVYAESDGHSFTAVDKGGYSSQHYFTGRIDDLQVFDRVVSAQEVTDMFVQHPVIAARWKLNSDGADDSGLGRTVTFGGDAPCAGPATCRCGSPLR